MPEREILLVQMNPRNNLQKQVAKLIFLCLYSEAKNISTIPSTISFIDSNIPFDR